MKRVFMTGFIALLLVTFLISAFPVLSQAANDDSVLKTLSHSAATNTVNVSSTRSATLILPYSYSASTIDLANGRIITWDTNIYSTVSVSFSGDATVNGAAVTMTVTYVRIDDPLNTYTTDYSVTVVRAEPEAATFSGSSSKTVTYLNTASYLIGEDKITARYARNDGLALAKIVIEGSNPAYGSLKVGNSDYVLGSDIPESQLGNLKFVPTGLGLPVSYEVYAYDTASTQINTAPVFLNITIAQPVAGDITYNTYNNKTVTFVPGDFNAISQTMLPSPLSYVRFSLPDSAAGTLYYNYTSSTNNDGPVSEATSYYYSSTSPQLSKVAFVPKSTYTGTVTVNYTAYDTLGNSYAGKVKIVVTAAPTTAADITYSIDEDEVLKMTASNFNTVCKALTGNTLDYVKFNFSDSAKGKLYYDYTSSTDYEDTVGTSDKYYYSGSSSKAYLSKVAFVPKSGYSGSVTVPYTGYDADGNSYSGSVKITVGDSGDVKNITYTTDEDTALKFTIAAFNKVCDDYTGYSLDYVKFDTFASSIGKLYYDYDADDTSHTSVSSSTKYYYSGSSSKAYLSKVTFVPKSGYTGTATLTYTGYDTQGTTFTGKIKITVGGSGDTTITYTTDQDVEVDLVASDFNEACDAYLGTTLSYVKFSAPSSGKLYYDYDPDDSSNTSVSTSTKYYYKTTSPLISKVTFVPKTGYNGVVTISYTGYDASGDSFTGKIKITVGGGSTITYTTYQGTEVDFLATDFNEACDAYLGTTLSYVKFNAPTSGKLYYNYVSASNYDSVVSTSAKYYYKTTSPLIAKVTFVPNASYTGTITLTYTGYDTSGDSFTGKIKITVTGAAPGTGSGYFSDVTGSYSWAAPSIDYLYSKGVVAGISANQFGPKVNISRADFTIMLCRAFNLKAAAGVNTPFADVKSARYYYSSVMIAKSLGIAEGSGGYFYPTSSLTREDAMVLVLRTLKETGKNLTAGTSSDLSSFSDRNKISSYAYDSVATLVKAKIISGTSAGVLSPKGNITRAEMAVILYRILTTL